jgi:hypothetical protein
MKVTYPYYLIDKQYCGACLGMEPVYLDICDMQIITRCCECHTVLARGRTLTTNELKTR